MNLSVAETEAGMAAVWSTESGVEVDIDKEVVMTKKEKFWKLVVWVES